VSVDHGGLDISVAQQFLDGADIIAIFQQVGSEAVPEGMGCDVFGQAGLAGSRPDCTPYAGRVEMVPPAGTCAGISGGLGSREKILPAPIARRGGILAGQPAGQFHCAIAFREGVLVGQPDSPDVSFEGRKDSLGKQRAAVLTPLTGADSDLPAIKIQVLDPQSEGFRDPQAGPVEQLADQPMGSGQFPEDSLDLAAAEHHGQVFGALSGDREDLFVQLDAKHLLIEELQGRQSLVLGGGGDGFIDCQVGQILFDLHLAHFAGVALVMEKNKTLDPGQIGFFSAVGIVEAPDLMPDLVEQFRRRHLPLQWKSPKYVTLGSYPRYVLDAIPGCKHLS